MQAPSPRAGSIQSARTEHFSALPVFYTVLRASHLQFTASCFSREGSDLSAWVPVLLYTYTEDGGSNSKVAPSSLHHLQINHAAHIILLASSHFLAQCPCSVPWHSSCVIHSAHNGRQHTCMSCMCSLGCMLHFPLFMSFVKGTFSTYITIRAYINLQAADHAHAINQLLAAKQASIVHAAPMLANATSEEGASAGTFEADVCTVKAD